MRTQKSIFTKMLGCVIGSTIIIYGIAYFWLRLIREQQFSHPPPALEILTDVAIRYFLADFLIAPTIMLTGIMIIIYSTRIINVIKEGLINKKSMRFLISVVICWIGFVFYVCIYLFVDKWILKYQYRVWVDISNELLGGILFFIYNGTPLLLLLSAIILLVVLTKYRSTTR